ncbi:MAG: YafY family transcriptional regulator [Rhodanobacteraceae bacterium]|nr:YafY family transcriptional regulator [Rhodanobacteraceae bacterium]
MRRGDRLFQLLLELGRGRVRTARQLGERLGVSERTVYRDIADLAAQGTPVEGAAGVGYSLRAGYQVPPLMFERDELEALALGAAWVSAYADDDLRVAADRVLSKIDAVLPQRLRPGLKAEGIEVLAFSHDPGTRRVLSAARRGMKERRKLSARYVDLSGQTTQRVLWPLGLFYWGKVWTLAAWCELRADYRSFRIDRFAALDLLPVAIPDSASVSLQEYLACVRDDPETRGR